jgi:phosphomannomutase
LSESHEARAAFFDTAGPEHSIDRTDGLRVIFKSGEIVHLRHSGNAPEFRCYTEASSAMRARNPDAQSGEIAHRSGIARAQVTVRLPQCSTVRATFAP